MKRRVGLDVTKLIPMKGEGGGLCALTLRPWHHNINIFTRMMYGTHEQCPNLYGRFTSLGEDMGQNICRH